MNSSEAEEMAKAMILYVRAVERSGIPAQVGIMDMRPSPPTDAWQFKRPADGVTVVDYVADQYRQIIEARDERR
jgi:hypothetical protein